MIANQWGGGDIKRGAPSCTAEVVAPRATENAPTPTYGTVLSWGRWTHNWGTENARGAILQQKTKVLRGERFLTT